MEKKKLPEKWISLQIDELTEIVSGGTPKTKVPEYFGGDIPWITPADLSKYKGMYIAHGKKNITKLGLKKSSARLLPKDSILFSSRAPIGYVAIAENELATNQGFKNLLPNQAFNSKYAYYFLKTAKHIAESMASGTTFLEISGTKLGKITIPIAPRPEQDRIVAKVDILMAQVETMQKSLERIPQLLKDFRQQVLTQAVTGKLNLNIGLDDSVLALRTVSIVNLVKSLKKDIRTGPFGSALKKEEHQLDGIPVWGIESIGKEGKFTGNNKIFVTKEKAINLKSFEVKGGDVIISRSGTVGELCVLPDNIPYGLISTNLMKIVLNKDVIISKFFCWIIKADPGILNRLEELCKGSTRLFLTQTILQKLEFNIPNLKEQQEIVSYVEKLFAKADAIEEKYLSLKTKIETLPQAILHKAFKGELVKQLPTDGDAKELLREIEALKKLKVK